MPTAQHLLTESFYYTMGSSSGKKALGDYGSCMEKFGVQIDPQSGIMPKDLDAETPEAQREIARKDFDCRKRTQMPQRLLAIETEYQKKQIQRARGQLEKEWAQYVGDLNFARRAIQRLARK